MRDAPKQRHNEQTQSPAQSNDAEILAQQLGFIISKLYALYPAHENVHYCLKNASELLRAYNIESAAETLHKILNNPELVASHKAQHDAIVEEAKNYGKYVEANWQQIKASTQAQYLPPQFAQPQANAFGGVYAPNLMFADANRHVNSGNAYSDPNFNNKGNK